MAFKTWYGHYEFLTMSFGLANASKTFIDIKNRVFKKYLDKVHYYISMIFWFILRWNKSMYLRITWIFWGKKSYMQNFIFQNMNFDRTSTVLWHIVSEKEMSVDPLKIETLSNWDRLRTRTEVRNILGLARYCRWFVKDFSKNETLLTKLIRKEEKFEWTPKCEESFQKKRFIIITPVLTLLEETRNFVIYSDASEKGLVRSKVS